MRLVLLFLTFCAVPAIDALGAATSSRPNIVILYADDMGYGDLGIQNPESKIPTPNLDRLAREGLRFTDAHSSSGICTPSRYALLTGRFHWRKFHDIVNSSRCGRPMPRVRGVRSCTTPSKTPMPFGTITGS
jgi:arylsulfatase A